MRRVIGYCGSLVLVICVGLFLQACGGGDSEGGRGETQPTRKPQVVMQVIEPYGNPSAINALYLAESGTQVVKKIADLGEYFPARRFSVSPGGKNLAYWSFDSTRAPAIYSFWLSNIHGSVKRQIHFSVFEPKFYWSSDGESLLYIGYEGLNQIAMLINLVDETETLLTSPGQLLTAFAWSEDGAHFVYDLSLSWANHEVCVRDLKTSTTKSIFSTADESITKLFISYNGSYVVVVAESSVDRLHIIKADNAQTATLNNVFLYDFDWLPGRNSAYYANGHDNTLYRLDLEILSVSPVTYSDGEHVLANEAFLSPDASKLFFNSYGLPSNVVGILRTLDNSVQYSRSLIAGASYPFGVVAWRSFSDKVAVVYEDMVSVIDAIAGTETEIKKIDSTSLGGISIVEWLGDEEIALQLNGDIYVGELTKNNFQKIGAAKRYSLSESAFQSLFGFGALFYLSVVPVNGIAAPSEVSGLGIPVYYDVRARRYHVFRLENGNVPTASYFQVVK